MRHATLLLAAVLLASIGAMTASAQYDSTMAMSALYYCKSAYCDAGSIGSWSCAACSYHSSFTNVNVYHNDTIDSQGFTGYDSNANQIVVAFRGSSNIENWFNNLDFIKMTYPNPACGCEVHEGFFQEYLSLSASVLSDVKSLAASYPSASVLVTGHSLGAAVSILAALDIVQLVSNTVTVYNFGQPRVGDPAFAAWASSMLPAHKQFRVTHSYDPVPHVPLEIMGFLHTPHELWYDNDGSSSWSDCNDSPTAEDPNCSDSIIPVGIEDHLLYLGICTECSCSSSQTNHAAKALRSAKTTVGKTLDIIRRSKELVFADGRDRRRK